MNASRAPGECAGPASECAGPHRRGLLRRHRRQQPVALSAGLIPKPKQMVVGRSATPSRSVVKAMKPFLIVIARAGTNAEPSVIGTMNFQYCHGEERSRFDELKAP